MSPPIGPWSNWPNRSRPPFSSLGFIGGGPAVIRGDFRQIEIEPGWPAAETAHGIIYWSELRYTLP